MSVSAMPEERIKSADSTGDGDLSTCLRIFVADDHAVVRDGLRLLINSQPDMQVIGEAEDGRTAWDQIGKQQPDLVIMDLSMPEMSGIEATTRLLRQWPEMKVLALTMFEEPSYLRNLLEAGASGYVLKRSAAEELIRAIRVVAEGGTYLDPRLTSTVVRGLLRNSGPTPGKGEISGQALSERETQVLRLVAEGYTNKEVGVKLAISQKTVETYKVRAMKKLELDSRADVIRYAVGQGWLRQGNL
jgi:DNA-binding NarL/FixJ family response regulator